ncbi:MAG TPA: ribosome small subunit-dependent GTPase A, partial [Fimbriimonas sp.]|nr:ribosome small subunit-dependent GTPase A [Fimbriimonas sp.]
ALRKRHKYKEGERRLSLDDIVYDLLQNQPPEADDVETTSGQVVWVGKKQCHIRVAGVDLEVDLAGHKPAVGDYADAGKKSEESPWQMTSIRERTNLLSRPDVDNPHLQRVIVANIDQIFIVVSVVSPPLHPRLIDRYLIAIQKGGARPIIVVNKIDLAVDESHVELLAPYASLGVPILTASTFDESIGVERVRPFIEGRTSAFVGHSGVGKSSLCNALFPGLDLDTGTTMRGYGRGAHTTTASSLFEFEGGTKLIDTPGIRSFGLWKLKAEELEDYFPEFEGAECKFRDCRHLAEPGCGVKARVETGEIHPYRYETYVRLLNDL